MTVSRDEAERLRFWSGPQGGVPGGRAASRPTTTAWTARSRASAWARCCAPSRAMEKKYGLRCPNVFHAGDGNLHPLILFDANDAGRAAPHRGVRRRGAGEVRRGRRHHHRRARRRRREDQPDVRAVRRRRARAVPRGEARLRPAGPAQSGQGGADARALRRVRPHARARRRSCRIRSCRAFEPAKPSRSASARPRRAERRCACAAAAARISTATRCAARCSTRAPTPASSTTSRPSW